MERDFKFRDSKTQYCQDISFSQLDLPRFNAIVIKIPHITLWIQTDSKVYIQSQKTKNSQSNSEEEQQSWSRATTITTWGTGERINKLTNGTEQRTPKQTHKYSQLVFNKGNKGNTMEEKDSFSTNGAGTTGQLHAKKKKKEFR